MASKKDDRIKRAAERQEARANRTPQEQIALLDRKLGKGKGAVKERKRLEIQTKQEQ